MKSDIFQSCGHCWVFQICWHIECGTFTASSFRIWNSSTEIPSLPLALFIVRPTWLRIPVYLALGEWSGSRNDAKAETPVLWPPHVKSCLTGKDFDAGRDWGQEEKGMTGWDVWMASLTRWTWVWVNSGRWWWTGRPGVLRFMGLRRVGHDWATELNWIELDCKEIQPVNPETKSVLNVHWKDWC